MTVAWTDTTHEIAGGKLHLSRAGSGRPLLILHHDIGTPDRLPFYDTLAAQLRRAGAASSRLGQIRAPALAAQRARHRGVAPWLLADLGVADVSLVGLGFGGWIAAEMASQAPTAYPRWCWSARWASSRRRATSPTRRSFHIWIIRARVSMTRRRSPRSMATFPPTSWNNGTSAARWCSARRGSLHVQPDVAASAGRRAVDGAGGVGRR